MITGKPIGTTECPKCACLDGENLHFVKWWGQSQVKRRCRHCRHEWLIPWDLSPAEPEKPAPTTDRPVAFPMIHCPACESAKTHVTSTRRPIRHHKCDACGHCFKSHEPE